MKLSEKITGKSFIDCYVSRMGIVKDHLFYVAEQLAEMGYKVYHSFDHVNIQFLHIEDESNQITFGFGEVPYRWYLSCEIDYRLNNGSSKTISESFGFDEPFSIPEIIKNMMPKVPVIVPSHKYLKLFEKQKNA